MGLGWGGVGVGLGGVGLGWGGVGLGWGGVGLGWGWGLRLGYQCWTQYRPINVWTKRGAGPIWTFFLINNDDFLSVGNKYRFP